MTPSSCPLEVVQCMQTRANKKRGRDPPAACPARSEMDGAGGKGSAEAGSDARLADGSAAPVSSTPRTDTSSEASSSQPKSATAASTGPAELGPGSIVANRYRIDRIVGDGSMGRVWAGEHLSVGLPVAIKALAPAASQTPEIVARFKREAQLLGRIRSDS